MLNHFNDVEEEIAKLFPLTDYLVVSRVHLPRLDLETAKSEQQMQVGERRSVLYVLAEFAMT